MFLLPIFSAVLLYLSFPPADLGPLAWGALIPLILFALREPKGSRAFLLSWLGGFLFFTAGLFWLRHTAPFGPFGIGAYKGLSWGLFALILRRLHYGARWPVAVAAPAAWLTLEYVRSYLFGGMPWLLAGYTQHRALGVIQIADLGGVWLVSALVLFVNGAAAQALLQPERRRRWSAAAFASVVIALVYGTIRLSTLPEGSGPVVGIVQPNIPQEIKNIGRHDPIEGERIFDKHLRMTRELVQRVPEVALVVWPESAIQEGVYYHRAAERWLRVGRFETISDAVREVGRPLLAGMLVGDVTTPGSRETSDWGLIYGVRPEDLECTNSALLFDAHGAVRSRYNKIRLVQFTERMPFEPLIPVKRIVAWFLSVPKVYEFLPGRKAVTFEIAGRTFGVCICSENFYPDIWRENARNGASVIVNISNEGWFRDSAELDHMLAMAKFRAVENRVACVRATNTGISVVLDAGGRIVRTLAGPDGAVKTVEGTMALAVPAGPGGSPYGVIGDAAAWAAAAATLAGLAWNAFFAKR
ncbi:MAG TPA: apolipoprotein N-acyltransferase [Planctomycetota bacterium]|nr:apolipoprotein N-acyltransferase [Planctomycetota bacterium]